jgi:hypothetical protein
MNTINEMIHSSETHESLEKEPKMVQKDSENTQLTSVEKEAAK